MNSYKIFEDVPVNGAGNLINQKQISDNALSGNYNDLRLSADSDRWFEYYNGAITHGYIDLKKFNNKPLVVAFYSGKWGSAGLNLLRSLNTIQAEVKANGGNLLVVIPRGEQHLDQMAWLNSLTLSFYVDEANALANRLGIHAGLSSGLNKNVLVPAVYVADARREITYKHVYRNQADGFSVSELISAVYSSALLFNKKVFI
ncbi:redoxin domain-containing protein [Mucilaginibacter sp. JRF]|uniref:redoxin family protein n=1 Tax=Mucilaginibacter sp. JRF TaxID=2780088 RepID=UPI001881D199|nr:redoxin family protein [Mucilaginibacter sp. JRF]MBE9582967.1 redoxin domain-containing protein [Mucilaginibacter sp. JRF]